MKSLQFAAVSAGIALAVPGGAIAEEVGKQEYMQACAVCHGESGKGDGELAPLMNIEVPSLTTLAKNNDGEFPMLKVIHIIDGRTGVRGHGSVMPVWGDRFKAASQGGPYGTELEVRGRVMAIAEYLQSIQE